MINDKSQIYLDRSSGCACVGIGTFGCGGVGGIGLPILGFAKLGFGWGLFVSPFAAVLGGVAGATAGFFGGAYLSDKIIDRDIKLDQKALAGERPYVTIAYHGEAVNCVLREDYDKSGHIFRLRTGNDDFVDVQLNYRPQEKDKFIFQTGVKSRIFLPETKFETMVQERVAGIDQIFAGVDRIDGKLVASARLESRVIGPEEILHISIAATRILATSNDFLENYSQY